MSFICANCVGEPYLRRLVQDAATADDPCEYCEDGERAVDLRTVAEWCDKALDTFFEVSSNTMAVIHFGRTAAGNSLPWTICDLTQMPEEAVDVVLEHLAELWYDPSSDTTRYGDDEPWFVQKSSMSEALGRAWQEMADSLRSDVRYFNTKASTLLGAIFENLTDDRDIEGQPVVVPAGPGTSLEVLYRGRVFQTEDALNTALRWPERLLGSPAVGIGAAGRMNGRGQPAFYGATAPEICIAELRPPVSSRIAVARFNIVSPLRLLDLRRLANVELRSESSLFDEATRSAVQRRDFLRTLAGRLSQPVLPELQEQDYLVTQAVADYLAGHQTLNVDGIIYPSSQSRLPGAPPPGDNVVLFRKACEVVDADARDATAEVHLWEYEDDGPGRCFRPTIAFKDREARRHVHRAVRPVLSLQKSSIVVYEISAVSYASECHVVTQVDSLNGWGRK